MSIKFNRVDYVVGRGFVIGCMVSFPPEAELTHQLQFDNLVGDVLRWCDANAKHVWVPMTQRNSARVPKMQPNGTTFFEYEYAKSLIMQIEFNDKSDADLFKKHWG